MMWLDPAVGIIVVAAVVTVLISLCLDRFDSKRKRAGPHLIRLTGGLELPRPNVRFIGAGRRGSGKPRR